jgi:hypothetical protein
MDPGSYRVVERMEKRLVGVENDFSVYSNEAYLYKLIFTRRVWVNEKKKLPYDFSVFSSLKELHVSFEHRMRNHMDQTLGCEVGLWSILQVTPPGTMIVPIVDFSDGFFSDAYFEHIPKERMKKGEKSVSVFMDGSRRYKLGFPPKAASGSVGYISRLKSGDWYAIVKLFSTDPGGKYVDMPKKGDRENGDVIQLYNHSEGKNMAFAELGCHAPAPFLAPGEEQVFPVSIIFLEGKEEEVFQAVGLLIGDPEFNVFKTAPKAAP